MQWGRICLVTANLPVTFPLEFRLIVRDVKGVSGHLYAQLQGVSSE